jgi:hypothetical protein
MLYIFIVVSMAMRLDTGQFFIQFAVGVKDVKTPNQQSAHPTLYSVKMRFFPTGKMTGALTEPFTSIQYHGQK